MLQEKLNLLKKNHQFDYYYSTIDLLVNKCASTIKTNSQYINIYKHNIQISMNS